MMPSQCMESRNPPPSLEYSICFFLSFLRNDFIATVAKTHGLPHVICFFFVLLGRLPLLLLLLTNYPRTSNPPFGVPGLEGKTRK